MKAARTTSTWLYCAVRASKRPAVRGRPAGVPGAGPVRFLDAGKRLWLVVAAVPREAWTAERIESKLNDFDWLGGVALGHESVVERFTGAEALLPAKLFTLFHDDASALAHIAGNRRAIDRSLGRVAARVELGVRIALDEQRLRRKADADARRQAKGAAGAGFLLRKQAAQVAARAGGEQARERVEALHRKLAAKAVEAVQKEIAASGAGGARLLLDAAYLVEARRAEGFRREAKKLAKDAAREGLELALTGPWPPYHFAGAGR